MINITDEEVEKALHYLAESAKSYAQWKSRMKYLESHRKSIRASETLRATGKTISENINRAEASEAYKDILKEYKEAVYEYELISAYRHAAEVKIEVWRSVNASQRRGNL